jgi:hypothetical protein
MTGRKMPTPGHALLDIYSEYDTWLCTYGGRLNEHWRAFVTSRAAHDFVRRLQGASDLSSTWQRILAGRRLIARLDIAPLFDEAKPISKHEFDELRERAKRALLMHRVLLDNNVEVTQGADIMLRRIIRNCDQLKGILEAHAVTGTSPSTPSARTLIRGELSGMSKSADTVFSGDEIVTIRKVWELGTETIVSQTVVQLDGDVVTRINEASPFADDQVLRDFHREGVATALSHWNALVETFVTITTKLLGYLTGR